MSTVCFLIVYLIKQPVIKIVFLVFALMAFGIIICVKRKPLKEQI